MLGLGGARVVSLTIFKKGEFLYMDNKRKIEVLGIIAQDMKDDAEKFDGRPFDGKTVAEYFGNQGAAIASLAEILKSTIENKGG